MLPLSDDCSKAEVVRKRSGCFCEGAISRTRKAKVRDNQLEAARLVLTAALDVFSDQTKLAEE